MRCLIVTPRMSGSGGCAGYNEPRFTGTLEECLQLDPHGNELIINERGNRLFVHDQDYGKWIGYTDAIDALIELVNGLQLSIAELAITTGVSERTLRRIGNGEEVSAAILAKLKESVWQMEQEQKDFWREK